MLGLRREIQLPMVLSVSLAIVWFFVPAISYKSSVYSLDIMGFGFSVSFLNLRNVIYSALPLASLGYALVGGALPVVWRTKYSLYLSSLSFALSGSMMLTSLIYVERYMHYAGYSLLPSPTGYFFIYSPVEINVGPPTFLVFTLLGLSLMNSWKGASWMGRRLTLFERTVRDLERGDLKGLLRFLEEINAPFTIREWGIETEGMEIRPEGSTDKIDLLFPRGKTRIVIGKRMVIINNGHDIKVIDHKQLIKYLFNELGGKETKVLDDEYAE